MVPPYDLVDILGGTHRRELSLPEAASLCIIRNFGTATTHRIVRSDHKLTLEPVHIRELTEEARYLYSRMFRVGEYYSFASPHPHYGQSFRVSRFNGVIDHHRFRLWDSPAHVTRVSIAWPDIRCGPAALVWAVHYGDDPVPGSSFQELFPKEMFQR